MRLCSQISDVGAVALARVLHTCSFKMLILSNNNISCDGAIAVAEALHNNDSVTSLDLSNNNISDGGAVALAQALHHNSTLEWLHLDGNDGIGEEGTRQLVAALTLKTLKQVCPLAISGRSVKRATRSKCHLILPKRCEEHVTPGEVDLHVTLF